MPEKVCTNCRRFVKESVCPACRESKFSTAWKGVVIVNDPASSEVAKALEISVPGKYCLWVK